MNRKERSRFHLCLLRCGGLTSSDLQSFREALSILQHQVDDLDELKASHYRTIVEHEEQVWEVVQSKVSISGVTRNLPKCSLILYRSV